MKKIVLSAALAAFALSVASAHASSLPVTVTKTKIPDGCEYKKVPGKKQKQLICIEEMEGGGGGGGSAAIDPVDPGQQPTPDYRGKSNNIVGANNGKGNGTSDGTPGNSTPKDEPLP